MYRIGTRLNRVNLSIISLLGVFLVSWSGATLAQEETNPLETAGNFTLTGKKRITLTSAKDEQFFRVRVRDNENPARALSGNLLVKLSQRDPPGIDPNSGWRVNFYSERDLGNSLYTLEWPETTIETRFEVGLSQGNYYYKVSSLSDTVYPKKEVSFENVWEESEFYEKEPNGVSEKATAMVLNETYGANFSAVGDVDFYRFSLTQPDTVTILLTQETPSSDTQSGWSFSLVGYGEAASKTMASTQMSETLSLDLPTGVYYLRVEPFVNTEDCQCETEEASVKEVAVPGVVGRRYQVRVGAPSAPVPAVNCEEGEVYGQHPTTLSWIRFHNNCEVPENWFKTEVMPEGFTECPICPICSPPVHANVGLGTGLLHIPLVDLKDDVGNLLGVYSANLSVIPDSDFSRFQLDDAALVDIEPTVTTEETGTTEETVVTEGTSATE